MFSRAQLSHRSILILTLLLTGAHGCASAPDRGVTIGDVQGEGHASPFAGQQVTLSGVVTAVVERERDAGFFMQDPDGDDNPRTSDAIFVDMSKQAASLPGRGDLVQVVGTVEERGRENQLSVTVLSDASVTVQRSGTSLPAPVVVGHEGRAIPTRILSDEGMRTYAPDSETIDFWESLEGMLIEVRSAVVTGATSSYGDFVLVPATDVGSERATVAGGVRLRENDLNLDRIVVDPRIAGAAPILKVGDRINGPLRGVVHYDFAAPRLIALDWPTVSPGTWRPEVSEITSSETALTVASYNVLNLSFANQERRFTDVARTIVENLRNPDIIGLQEIQDDTGANRDPDGVVSAERTMQRLADSIVAAGGPRYDWTQIDPQLDQDGGQPGGNIRVAYFYRPDRVTLIRRGDAGALDATAVTTVQGVAGLSLSPGRIEPAHPCVSGGNEEAEGSRKPLAAEFRFRDRTIFLINAHLKSKSDDDRIFGSAQPPQRGSETQRTCQTEILRGFVRSLLDADSAANVILLGDLNEHEFRAPAKVLEQPDFVSLIQRVPANRRYTYNFEGNSQVLDQIFVSRSLMDRADVQIDVVHVNIDFPGRNAASDHDPVLARFDFR